MSPIKNEPIPDFVVKIFDRIVFPLRLSHRANFTLSATVYRSHSVAGKDREVVVSWPMVRAIVRHYSLLKRLPYDWFSAGTYETAPCEYNEIDRFSSELMCASLSVLARKSFIEGNFQLCRLMLRFCRFLGGKDVGYLGSQNIELKDAMVLQAVLGFMVFHELGHIISSDSPSSSHSYMSKVTALMHSALSKSKEHTSGFALREDVLLELDRVFARKNLDSLAEEIFADHTGLTAFFCMSTTDYNSGLLLGAAFGLVMQLESISYFFHNAYSTVGEENRYMTNLMARWQIRSGISPRFFLLSRLIAPDWPCINPLRQVTPQCNQWFLKGYDNAMILCAGTSFVNPLLQYAAIPDLPDRMPVRNFRQEKLDWLWQRISRL